MAWRAQAKAAVWVAPVVVLDVDAENTNKLLARGVPEIGQLSCRVVVFMNQAAEDITAAELLGDQRLRLAMAF
jgi:hypothetical protein